MAKTLPYELIHSLEEFAGSKEKAVPMIKFLEASVSSIENEAKEQIVEKKDELKSVLKEELRNELVTRELFEERFKTVDERFNVIDERFKRLEERFDFRFKVLIGVMLVGFTLFNPQFLELLKGLLLK